MLDRDCTPNSTHIRTANAESMHIVLLLPPADQPINASGSPLAWINMASSRFLFALTSAIIMESLSLLAFWSSISWICLVSSAVGFTILALVIASN